MKTELSVFETVSLEVNEDIFDSYDKIMEKVWLDYSTFKTIDDTYLFKLELLWTIELTKDGDYRRGFYMQGVQNLKFIPTNQGDLTQLKNILQSSELQFQLEMDKKTKETMFEDYRFLASGCEKYAERILQSVQK
jgi:hypothetical protein